MEFADCLNMETIGSLQESHTAESSHGVLVSHLEQQKHIFYFTLMQWLDAAGSTLKPPPECSICHADTPLRGQRLSEPQNLQR